MKSIFTAFLFISISNKLIAQNIGIGIKNPQSKLHISSGDIFLENNSQGIIMKSASGECRKISVNNSGNAVLTLVSCPNSSNVNFQNIGIGTNYPKTKLHLSSGDIFLENNIKGIIMKSPNGNCWRQLVDNAGNAVFNQIPCPGMTIGTITYGGQTYATKLMPDGKLWLAQNLNIGTMINSANEMTNNNIIEKYCYDNNPVNCTIYGGLYEWNEMKQYTYKQVTNGICPTGWRLPTEGDWTNLETALQAIIDNGSQLAGNTVLWNDGLLDQSQHFGTSGFNALPAGYKADLFEGQFHNQSNYTFLWASTDSGGFAWYRYLSYTNASINTSITNKSTGLSVRCLQD